MPDKTRFLAPLAAGGAEPVNSRVRLFGTQYLWFEADPKHKKERTAEGRFVLFGASNRTRFSARPARLGHSRSQLSTGQLLCTAPTSRSTSRTRTCDTIGQKHGRLARLERFAILPVSSCSRTACICHRQRRHASQLTARAALRAPTALHNHDASGSGHIRSEKQKRPAKADRFCLAPQTGLEPVTPRLTAACSTD